MADTCTYEDALMMVDILIKAGFTPLPKSENWWEIDVHNDERETWDKELSGLYVPAYIGPYPTPQDKNSLGGTKFPWCVRFKYAEGFNVTLLYRSMYSSPTTWLMKLATEMNAQTFNRLKMWALMLP